VAARHKDAGANAASLAWILSDMRIGPSVPVPGGLSPAELDAFRLQLIEQLTRMALPPE
jgi:hypothetical protein